MAEKKNRIQIDLNASTKDAFHYLSAVPTIPEEAKSYTPILYTFRVRTRGKTTKLKNVTSKPPPFYILLDHTLAVIWTLFDKGADKKSLGIVQLQWALYFLQSFHNCEGVHPGDIQLCIDTIQDYLIGQYADMSEQSVIYGENKFSGPEEKKEERPFSVNYAQMIDKCPPPVLEEVDSEVWNREFLQDLEKVKKTVGIDSVDLTKLESTQQIMDVLNDMKKEQLGKIAKEVKTLKVVEEMMEHTDKEKFGGYTDEKQLQEIFKKT